MDVEVKAPANVKISGEHSVVYGGPSLSAAIAVYATAKVEEREGESLEIVLKDLGLSFSLGPEDLKRLYKEYLPRETSKPDDLARYIAANTAIGEHLLPYATIAARLSGEIGIHVLGKRVTIHSDVPIQKGYASSAVCSTAFTVGLIKSSGRLLDDAAAIDISRDGERIRHEAEAAGRIDVGPAYYGGYAVFSAAEGIKRAEIQTALDLVVIDTGPKPSTAEMVRRVRELYNSETEGTKKTLDEIGACVLRCIDSLKRGDLRELGKQMSQNHELLRRLGVSSDGLDTAVSIAVSSGAYGAKLCGGGGGGICIALVGSDADAEKVRNAMKPYGFDAQRVSITLKGAKGEG